jgi:apolipoprotein N-acyltransferase
VGVIQTNNATFGRSPQSAQQFQISRVRAYEYRMPVLVAATTGKTALISSEGEVLQSLADFESGHLVVDVSPSQPNPPPIRTNHLLAASSLLIIGSLLWKAGRRRIENIRDRFLGRITA